MPIVQVHAPEARLEVDLLAEMMRKAFEANRWLRSIEGAAERDAARAELTMHSEGGQLALLAMASKSSDPDRRPANTADTYDQLARSGCLDPGQELLLVTSSIYRPYQHLQATRVLSLQHHQIVETVGVPSDERIPSHPPSGLLQEVRATLMAGSSLLGKP